MAKSFGFGKKNKNKKQEDDYFEIQTRDNKDNKDDVEDLSGETDLKKENKTVGSDIDIEALIAKITLETQNRLALEYNEKINKLEKALSKKENVGLNQDNIKSKDTVKRKYKFIPDDTKVRIKSNISGKFYFKEDFGKARVFIQLDGVGDSTVLSYEELTTFIKAHPKFVMNGKIAIIDVYSNDDIELEDVLLDLRLDKVYSEEELITPLNLEDLFSRHVDIQDFEKFITTNKNMAETVLELGYYLYRKGKFTDNTKMNYLRQIFGNYQMFK